MHYLFILLGIAQFLLGVGLIAAVLMQESKNEGLTGQIGTSMTSSFKGKAGREERLNDMTRKMATAFFIISILVAYGTNRW